MRRSNFALRLQPSLLEQLRKAAEVEGVALNQLINVAVAEKVSALRTEEYFRKGVAGLIAPKPCGFLNVLDKGIPLWQAMNFPRSRARSQAAAKRMREIRPSGDRRKGSLLNSGAAPSPSAEIVLVDVLSPTERRRDAFALLHLGLLVTRNSEVMPRMDSQRREEELHSSGFRVSRRVKASTILERLYPITKTWQRPPLPSTVRFPVFPVFLSLSQQEFARCVTS
jgi:hypothetical protein